jgi:formate hydrogenlyase subunit 3/multisubunit Na+/H+ antiporter MnhD subunit
MSGLLLAAVLFPAAVALLLIPRGGVRVLALALAPWTPVPALALALRGTEIEVAPFPWLLLGARIGLDLTGQVFLLFTALLWTAAGVYARAYLRDDPGAVRFFIFHLLTLTGNLGLLVAHDVATFYLFFAFMTFAAYPLVVHAGDSAARRAGRVYLVLAVLGETMLLTGFLLAVQTGGGLDVESVAAGVAASPRQGLVAGLILGGFGVKAGALPLHVWLPLAHPVAPTPASAVLSGSMIKAGLLGWIRFLPLGEAALPGWGTAVLALGLVAAFFGVLIGVLQDDAKTALAYSSISQMGILNVGVGIGLINPEGWSSALAATLAYATHHGLAKGALFLGVGVAAAAATAGRPARLAVAAGLGFAALAVAGAPLTSGSVAKGYLKEVAALSPGAWPVLLDWLLPLTAVGTTLLMARFLSLALWPDAARAHGHLTRGLWAPWAALLVALAVVVWALPAAYELEVEPPGLPYPGAVWLSIWPIVAGLLLAWLVLVLRRRRTAGLAPPRVAAGDLLIPLERTARRASRLLRAMQLPPPLTPVVDLATRWHGLYAETDHESRTRRAERRLGLWPTAGLLLVVLALALLAVLAAG